jgi:hypothetical protein
VASGCGVNVSRACRLKERLIHGPERVGSVVSKSLF